MDHIHCRLQVIRFDALMTFLCFFIAVVVNDVVDAVIYVDVVLLLMLLLLFS